MKASSPSNITRWGSYQCTHLSDNLQRRQSSRSNVKIQEIAYQLLRQYTISRSDSEQQVSLKIVELFPLLVLESQDQNV